MKNTLLPFPPLYGGGKTPEKLNQEIDQIVRSNDVTPRAQRCSISLIIVGYNMKGIQSPNFVCRSGPNRQTDRQKDKKEFQKCDFRFQRT